MIKTEDNFNYRTSCDQKKFDLDFLFFRSIVKIKLINYRWINNKKIFCSKTKLRFGIKHISAKLKDVDCEYS